MQASILAFALALTSTAAAAAPVPEAPHFYRFWRGFKLPTITQEAFEADLSTRFVPTLPRTHGGEGLMAYHVALPPAGKPAFIAEEIALIAYESEEVYRALRATPRGQAYADLHWEIFQKDVSKSLVPQAMPEAGPVVAETSYDLIGERIDWQAGYTSFFIGLRKDGVTTEAFRERLADHVRLTRDTFAKLGMTGYIVLVTDDYEIAYLNWPSAAALDAALATAEGQAVVADAGSIMTTLQWSAATPFAGTVAAGDAVNVRFPLQGISTP